MSENTKIEWADHSWNPWVGCTKVSPGCAHCYAATRMWAKYWGKGNPRHHTSAQMWKEPLKWNKAAEVIGVCCGTMQETPSCHYCGSVIYQHRPRVFPSMCDWLDEEIPIEWLADFLRVIACTPNIDWLLLTKRPENWESRLRATAVYLQTVQIGHVNDPSWRLIDEWLPWNGINRFPPPSNVWIGTSVEDQQRADERIPVLLKIPAQVRFLSIEPLLGPLDITGDTVEHMECGYSAPAYRTSLKWKDGDPYCPECEGWPAVVNGGTILDGIQWVIVGGESGPKARLCNMGWIRGIVHECQDANVPVFVKQLGAIPAWDKGSSDEEFYLQRVRANMGWHDKGGDPAEWPADLRVRQFPEVPA